MSKKTEVIRATKEESRLVTLLRDLDRDVLITEIDHALQSQSSELDTLRKLRSVLKSEFIPPLTTPTNQTVSPQNISILNKAFESNLPIILIDNTANDTTGITFLKSLLFYFKHLLPEVALIDPTGTLTNSVSLMDSNTRNLTNQHANFEVIHALTTEQSKINRLLIVNNPRTESTLLLDLSMGYNLPFLWYTTRHPLEDPATPLTVKQRLESNLEETDHLIIHLNRGIGTSKYSIRLEQNIANTN